MVGPALGALPGASLNIPINRSFALAVVAVPETGEVEVPTDVVGPITSSGEEVATSLYCEILAVVSMAALVVITTDVPLPLEFGPYHIAAAVTADA